MAGDEFLYCISNKYFLTFLFEMLLIVLAFSVLLEGLRVSINHVVDGFFLFQLLLSGAPREFFDPHRQVDQFDEVSDAKIDFEIKLIKKILTNSQVFFFLNIRSEQKHIYDLYAT